MPPCPVLSGPSLPCDHNQHLGTLHCIWSTCWNLSYGKQTPLMIGVPAWNNWHQMVYICSYMSVCTLCLVCNKSPIISLEPNVDSALGKSYTTKKHILWNHGPLHCPPIPATTAFNPGFTLHLLEILSHVGSDLTHSVPLVQANVLDPPVNNQAKIDS